ncbi:MAG TPA: hypothetical protein VMS98_04030 [Thermoanaerobaculia bacterium]|nr:hypothetical protein [Thermoanaerobaculia bacterium]
MDVRALEPLLRNTTIKAIDSIANKIHEVEDEAETAVRKLLRRWNALTPSEKENIVGIVIATATTAVAAIAALKGSKPKKVVKQAKKKVMKAAKKAL